MNTHIKWSTVYRSQTRFVLAQLALRAAQPKPIGRLQCEMEATYFHNMEGVALTAAGRMLCEYQGRLLTIGSLVRQIFSLEPYLNSSEFLDAVKAMSADLGPIAKEAFALFIWNQRILDLVTMDDKHDDVFPSYEALQVEWHALSPEEQAQLRESLDAMCQNGIGDMYHFYPLLMPQMLVGYVGD